MEHFDDGVILLLHAGITQTAWIKFLDVVYNASAAKGSHEGHHPVHERKRHDDAISENVPVN